MNSQVGGMTILPLLVGWSAGCYDPIVVRGNHDGERHVTMAATTTATRRPALNELARGLGITRADLSVALGASESDLARLESGESILPRDAADRLEQLSALHAHLFETFKPEGIQEWLNTPNRYIGSITKESTTPADAIRRGELEWVEGALVVIDYGIFV